MKTTIRRLLLLLLLVVIFLSTSVVLGEEDAAADAVDTVDELVDETGNNIKDAAENFVDAVDGDATKAPVEEIDVSDNVNMQSEESIDDDGAFDLNDLLPGLDNPDSQKFVSNYVMGDPEFYSKIYDPPGMVPRFNALPRFGHSDRFSLLMGKNPDDYFLGLLFIGTFVMAIFMMWAMIILILKCIGPKYVGVLAGFPFREEGKKSLAGRAVLSVAAWTMIAATIVLITKGLTEMQALSDTVDLTNYNIKVIEREIGQIVTTLQVVSAKTTPIRDELVDFLKRDICPLEPGTDTEDMVRDVGEDTYDAMTGLDDFIEGYLNDVESGVNQTGKFTDRIENIVGMAQFTNNWKVNVVIWPYFIIPSFILVAVCMGWFDVFSEGFYTFITWFILPLLVILTIVAIISASWMVIFLQADSDLCSPAPENTILDVLNQVDLDPDNDDDAPQLENGPSDNFFYDIMVFYTHQCTTPNPWEFLEGHYTDLARGRNILGEFLQAIEDTTLHQLSQECGHEYGPIVELLLQLQDLITILTQTSIRALNLMSCRNIVPLYTMSMYEATCTMAPNGLTWMFSCSVVIAFCGMISIMFRGAYYPIDYYYYDEKDLYPTDDESEFHLADNDCNDIVLQECEDGCHETMELVREENHFDVYNDDRMKEALDPDGSTMDETDTGNQITVGGEIYSIGTYEEMGGEYSTLNDTLTDDAGYNGNGSTFDEGYHSLNESLTMTEIHSELRSKDSC